MLGNTFGLQMVRSQLVNKDASGHIAESVECLLSFDVTKIKTENNTTFRAIFANFFLQAYILVFAESSRDGYTAICSGR